MKKLIRDKIPELIKQNPSKKGRGGEEILIIKNKQEFLDYILQKVIEEQKELFEEVKNNNLQNILEELADNFEILETLWNHFWFNFDDIVKIKQEKKEKRWWFEKWYILIK